MSLRQTAPINTNSRVFINIHKGSQSQQLLWTASWINAWCDWTRLERGMTSRAVGDSQPSGGTYECSSGLVTQTEGKRRRLPPPDLNGHPHIQRLLRSEQPPPLWNLKPHTAPAALCQVLGLNWQDCCFSSSFLFFPLNSSDRQPECDFSLSPRLQMKKTKPCCLHRAAEQTDFWRSNKFNRPG